MQRMVAFLLALAFTSQLWAQNSSALINEALDKIYPLDLNTTLPKAMSAIGEQTGVRLEAAPSVWELLPWGDQTTISAKIEGKTLRDALDAITRKLGLIVVLREQAVELRPMPALMRLGRRANVRELAALDLLATTPLGMSADRPTLRELLEAIDKKLLDLKSPYAIENRGSEVAGPEQRIFVARNATLLEALEAISRETRATWYPWDRSLVVLPKDMQIRNQLDKTIAIRYNGADVSQVLAELSQRSGVEFTVEPGAIARISPELRTVRVVLSNVSVRQALENLAGLTGLGYVVNENGVYIWNQMTNPAGGARDPVVGTIQLDNGMNLYIRQSEVTPEIQEYLRTRSQRAIQKIREMMKEEGFIPTTRPTTSPDL